MHETAIEIAESVRAGERKATEVLDECLADVAAGNDALNAFVHLDEAQARATAEAVDATVARGGDPGPFAGVPFGVKDLDDCAGMPTSHGSLVFKGQPPAVAASALSLSHRPVGSWAHTAMPRVGDARFTGRDAEMARLRAAVAESGRGRGRVVAIIGEAGVGKTRLVEELAAEVDGASRRVLLGRCHESEQNLPFALSVAKSAADPDDPETVTGRETKPFYIKSEDPYKDGIPGVNFAFKYSYGDPQPVQVLAKRSLGKVTLKYRINNGRTHSAGTKEWRGGEKYKPADVYYHELRGTVRLVRDGLDRVLHERFGVGEVVDFSGFGPAARVTVDFAEHGRRRLVLEFARLRRAAR